MPTASKPQPPSTQTRQQVTEFQSYRYEEIDRRKIQGAPYNPRRIGPAARKRLLKSLQSHGLVETPVWNRRTGNLVGGHQRLSILDQLEGRQDYTVGVAVIDVDETDEQALNVLLNNPHAQGMFDPDKMIEMLKLPEAPKLEDMGLTRGELEMEIGAMPELDDLFGEPAGRKGKGGQAEEDDILAVRSQAGSLQKEERQQQKAAQGQQTGRPLDSETGMQKRREWQERTDQKPEKDVDYFLIVRFDSEDDKQQFLDHAALPSDITHLDAGLFKELLKPELADWQQEGQDPEPVPAQAAKTKRNAKR